MRATLPYRPAQSPSVQATGKPDLSPARSLCFWATGLAMEREPVVVFEEEVERSGPSGFQACCCWISGPAGGMSNSSSRRAGNETPRLRSDAHTGGYTSSLVSGSSVDFTTPRHPLPITAQPRASTTTAAVVTSWAGRDQRAAANQKKSRAEWAALQSKIKESNFKDTVVLFCIAAL